MDDKQYSTDTIKRYYLQPTTLIPNSSYPLLHYPGFLAESPSPSTPVSSVPSANAVALRAHKSFVSNGWESQWMYRYGHTQQAHYHSRVHECMVVLCGEALITFGIADSEISTEDQITTALSGTEADHVYEQGITVNARVGDVFIIPAGVAHKTHHVTVGSEFALLTPGTGHGIVGKNGKASDHEIEEILSEVEIDGFAMFASYPNSRTEEWDFAVGGEDVGGFEKVWNVPVPARDPILGDGEIGLTKSWA